MKLVLNVTFKEASRVIRAMIDNARWAEDENYNRLPKKDRILMAQKCRELVSQLLQNAVGDEMTDILSEASCLSCRIDDVIREIDREEEE